MLLSNLLQKILQQVLSEILDNVYRNCNSHFITNDIRKYLRHPTKNDPAANQIVYWGFAVLIICITKQRELESFSINI